MSASGMVGRLPFRVNDRPFSDFDDAISRHKPYGFRSFDEIDVSPL